jgi:transcriptional regulator with XRE-family HTH domain
MKVTGKQIASARELLGITQPELAAAAGVSDQTISNFETNRSDPYPATIEKITAALERRGIEFTNGDSPPSAGNGIGVRLNFDKAAAFARSEEASRKLSDR